MVSGRKRHPEPHDDGGEMMANCKMDTLVKTKDGRIVMVGDMIKALRAHAEVTSCTECEYKGTEECVGLDDCVSHTYELLRRAADVLEVLTEENT